MGISVNSIIDPGASIGKNVEIGHFAVIGPEVVIGDNVSIGNYCEIGLNTNLSLDKKTFIGSNSKIRSNTKIYDGVKIGENFSSGHNVTIRENSLIGSNVQIGTMCDIQGDCVIENFSRLHSNVHISKGSKIHDFVWIFPYVVLTNDPRPPSETRANCIVSSFAVIATMSVLLPGVNIGVGAFVGAHSLVSINVKNEELVSGNPAKSLGRVNRIALQDSGGLSAYPWSKRFRRDYPSNIHEIYLERLRVAESL
jgi:UDP-3-O-[3-hydroxymyristoyl] glucosamine N-acyltransferase